MTVEKIFRETEAYIVQLKLQYDSVNNYSCTLTVNEDNSLSDYREIISKKYFKDENFQKLLTKVYTELERHGLIEQC